MGALLTQAPNNAILAHRGKIMFSTSRAILLAIITIVSSGLAYGHVTVQPKQSTAGKTEAYTLRVPTEKPIPTVRVEVEFPEPLEVRSFEAKNGWKIEERKNAAGRLMGVVLTGSIPPTESVQFNFIALNPNIEGKLSFKATQVYQDGSRAEWTGVEGSHTPAPVIEIKK
jgi:Domain of unkown function (DUF1775)